MEKAQHNQSILKNADQLVRRYQIPVHSEKEDVLGTIFSKIKKGESAPQIVTQKISKSTLTAVAVAASIVLLLGLYIFTALETYSGKPGEILVLRLSDNSRVVLQGNSELKIRKYFRERDVVLTGSAYFEVEKGGRFEVHTSVGQVRVLGTRFLVSERNDSLNVLCYEGKVMTSISKSTYLLPAGEMVSGTKKQALQTKPDVVPEYPDFAFFSRNFQNNSLPEVAREMEMFFGVEILFRDGQERFFTGNIQTGNLDSALEIVCESMELNYRHEDKKRILIFKK